MKSEVLLKMLEDNIDNIFDIERYKKFLEDIGKFHRYSFMNQVLILLQRPDAMRVAGYNTWKNMGRQVKRGEHGIGILAPKFTNVYIIKAENRPLKYNEMTKDELKKVMDAGLVEKKRIKRGFLGVTVFDISQTEGKDLPANIGGLKGSYKELDKLYKGIEKATGSKVNVTKDMVELSIFGCFYPDTNTIEVRDLEDLQVAKTAIHEAGHSLAKRLRADGNLYEGEYKGWDKDGTEMMKLSRDDEEVIVESSAFIVLKQLGLDTSEYSFNYIQHWATAYRSTEEGKARLHQLLGFVSKIADKLLTSIENEMGIETEMSEEENEETTKEELADALLSTMEANAVRVKTNGGVVM